MALLAERDFDEISIPEIATGAGLSIGTFYRRFTDKEEFLDALFDRFEVSARETFGSPLELEKFPFEGRVSEVIRRVRAVYAVHGGLIRTLQKRAQDRPELYRKAGRLVTEVGAVLAAAVAGGDAPSPALLHRADLCARLIFSLCDQELAFGMFPPGGRKWSKSEFTAELSAIITVSLSAVSL